MRVSQFEIYRLCQRALEGLGAPYGVDQDGARAVAWLEARGLPGLAPLGADLARLDGSFAGLRLPAGEAIDAAGRSAIGFCGAVVDLLVALAAKDAVLHLRRCRSPLFLLPPAVAAASRGVAFDLAWQAGEGTVACRIVPPGRVALAPAPGPALEAMLLGGDGTDVAAASRRAEPGSAVAEPTEAYFAERLRQSLDLGIAVEPATWSAIGQIATRVQVPASEESRLKGAGGGDANE
jgi:hypothetical protein